MTAVMATATTFWCATALVDGVTTAGVRVGCGPDGTITAVESAAAALPDDVLLGHVVPGMGNAHSHAFHRALRGRTHNDGGDFWRWRDSMYNTAAALDPELYRELAVGVFSEMVQAGFTAVGEFHYVHHRQDGTAYPTPHAMELALASAAHEVGIRLTLLDTSYLRGGTGIALTADQLRFGDGTGARWLARWNSLRDALAEKNAGQRAPVRLGAAIHSVRAVGREDMAVILDGLPADAPLHIHLSEQPRENEECRTEYDTTPTGLLATLGALTPRLSVVHATHLTDQDVALLGAASVSVVMCPTTEADLGDGIGPARALADAGARIALGSDQNAVVDPFLESRGLEAGERLASGRRGRFSPRELGDALSTNGYVSLGLGSGGIAIGSFCDLVEVALDTVRTIGSAPEQIALTATAGDVLRVIVGGRVVADKRTVDNHIASTETSDAGRLPVTEARAAAALAAPLHKLETRIAKRGTV